MNLIDTSGINHIFDNAVEVTGEYFMSPEVEEEVELTELVKGGRTPSAIRKLTDHADFDEAVYLANYKEMLNKYRHRSFYNMRGFGDVSILAAVHTLLSACDRKVQPELIGTTEGIAVFTSDGGLTAFMTSEFAGKAVSVFPVAAIK